jgi:hypothetical protein
LKKILSGELNIMKKVWGKYSKGRKICLYAVSAAVLVLVSAIINNPINSFAHIEKHPADGGVKVNGQ